MNYAAPEKVLGWILNTVGLLYTFPQTGVTAVSDSISRITFLFPLFFVLENKFFFLPYLFSSVWAKGALYHLEID